MIRSLKSKLLLAFSSIVAIMCALSMYNVLLARRYSTEMNELFGQLSATTLVSVKLNEAHQSIANVINYKNPDLLPQAETLVRELVEYVKSIDPLLHKSAAAAGDPNLFYQYIQIQNLIYIYREKHSVLAAASVSEKARVVLYDNLYELKDLKGRIHEEITALLFRQTVATDTIFAAYSKRIGSQIYLSLAITLAVSALVLVFSVRTARRISRPVELLAKRALRAENGDFGPVPRPEASFPEVDTLVEAFDSMILRIGSLIGEIEEKAALEKRFSEEQIKTLRADNLLRSAELRLLQSQINPHFLFNAINTIVTLARIEEAEYTASLLDDMARILRYGLRTTKGMSTVGEELEIVRTYLRIQTVRFGSRMETRIDADPSCVAMPIPAMIFQPLVENAMNHGMEPKMGEVSLVVRVELDKSAEGTDYLLARVEDNGVGMDRQTLERLRGIALYPVSGSLDADAPEGDHGVPNVLRRLRLTYRECGIGIESSEGAGTVFSLRLPVSPDADRSGTRSDGSQSPS